RRISLADFFRIVAGPEENDPKRQYLQHSGGFAGCLLAPRTAPSARRGSRPPSPNTSGSWGNARKRRLLLAPFLPRLGGLLALDQLPVAIHRQVGAVEGLGFSRPPGDGQALDLLRCAQAEEVPRVVRRQVAAAALDEPRPFLAVHLQGQLDADQV